MHKTSETKRVKLLRKIDSILGSSYDLYKVIRKIYKEISKVLDTSNFYIAIYNRVDDTITFVIYTIGGKEIHRPTRKLSKGLTEYVIRTRKPLKIDGDVKRVGKKLGVKPVGKNAKSWLGLPMLYKGNVEGVITVQDYKKTHAYTIEDEILLTSVASRAAVVIANTKLIEEEMKRAKELSLMNQIAHRLTKSLKLVDIFESVTQSIIEVFKNFNVAIFLVENKELVLKKLSKAFKTTVSRDLRLKIGAGIVGNVAKKRKIFIANDVSKVKRYLCYGQSHTRSEVAIPLRIGHQTIGVLNVECNELNAFNKNSVRILELIADRLSVALHNAQLYEDATDHAKELAVSFTIAQSLISTLELKDVLNRILEVIRDTFGFANIAILLIDKDKKELFIKAAHGYSRYTTKNVRLKIGKQGICGQVAATGEMFYAPDVRKIPYYVQGKKSVRSEVAVPLKIRGEVIGVLDIESEKLNFFTEKDLRMFLVFASQAAIAIENARLFDETKALSLTDVLTKAANRRHFNLMLESELRKARGYTRPLSLAMIDLDNFKGFNDRFGHPAGDKMLIHIAATLKGNIRDTDFLARYGGEEFVVIFPETSKALAVKVSERIRSAVVNAPLVLRNRGRKKITISIGIASFPENANDEIELIKNTDKALYHAKKSGKNRVEIFK